MKVVFFCSALTPNVDNHAYLFEENGIEFEKQFDITDDDEKVELCKGADAIITSIADFPAKVVERLDSSVKCIMRTTVGYDIIDVDACNKRSICVCNVPDHNIQEVATHAVTLMLAAQDKTVIYDKRMRTGSWKKMGYREEGPVHRISALNVGILGFGKIGRIVAGFLKGFGCKIYAYDPYLPDSVFEGMGVLRAKTLDDIYAVVDMITIHIPLFKENYHMINSESIAKMKDGVIIVNTARGQLIDSDALVEALRSGKVRAAGLDVFETEPLNDPNCPFFELENVILTPHIATYSLECREDLSRKSVEIAIAGAKGEVPYSCVNKKAIGRA